MAKMNKTLLRFKTVKNKLKSFGKFASSESKNGKADLNKNGATLFENED